MVKRVLCWSIPCNRGGLFEVSDICYSVFREIELKVHKCIFSILGRTTLCDNETIVSSVASDDEVQFYWATCL